MLQPHDLITAVIILTGLFRIGVLSLVAAVCVAQYRINMERRLKREALDAQDYDTYHAVPKAVDPAEEMRNCLQRYVTALNQITANLCGLLGWLMILPVAPLFVKSDLTPHSNPLLTTQWKFVTRETRRSLEKWK